MADTKSKGLKMQIYNYVKDKIVFCDFMPGSVISEDNLCKEFGVSRTPVREALLELEKEGYVNIMPRKSTTVSKISLKDINDIIQARLLIEIFILKSISKPLSEEIKKSLIDIRNRFDDVHKIKDDNNFKLMLQMDFDFHSTLATLCPNSHLVKFLQELLTKSVRQWCLMFANAKSRINEAISEHESIIDALLNEDFEDAAKKLESHIKAFYDMIYIINE